MTNRLRPAVLVACALCSLAVGCATGGTPVSLTQWSWGRSLSFGRGEDSPPSFGEDSDAASTDEKPADAQSPKEPRRLFGWGSSPKHDEDFYSNQPSHGPDEVPQLSNRKPARPAHWYDRFQPSSKGLSPEQKEAQQRQRQQQFDHAEQLFQQERYDEAIAELKPLSRKPKTLWQQLSLISSELDYREDHDRIREDAMFLLAESYVKTERFTEAKRHYEALLKEYPSTRHLNVATRRLFGIARTWLGFPEFVTSNDVTPVNLENPRATKMPPKQKPPHSAVLIPNFFDKTRPTFDTPGEALQALKAIWMYDPRGPLADDAIMLTASHYLRLGNYEEADRYFSMLREEYPNSPHLQTAFVLGSHVKLMSYQGAAYDEKQLEDARQLKESTLRLFPNLPEKERIQGELARIDEARAQRLWELVQLYGRKEMPKAQIIYAQDLLNAFPNSRYAPQARELLAKLQTAPDHSPSIGTRVLDSLPRLRRTPQTPQGMEVDSSGSARLNDDLPDASRGVVGEDDPLMPHNQPQIGGSQR